MNNPLDFFSGKTVIKRITLHEPSRRLHRPDGMGSLDHLSSSASNWSLLTGNGTEYAKEYIEAEEQKLYEVFIFITLLFLFFKKTILIIFINF